MVPGLIAMRGSKTATNSGATMHIVDAGVAVTALHARRWPGFAPGGTWRQCCDSGASLNMARAWYRPNLVDHQLCRSSA